MLPADPLRDLATGLARTFGSALQRDRRDVDRRELPAMLGEPDRVCAFATANVERRPRDKVGDLRDELRIRIPAPDLLGRAVSRIPVFRRQECVWVQPAV